MKHRYLPMTEQDKQEMLDVVGVSSVDELFEDIPEIVRFKGLYDIKEAKSESALLKELSALAAKNKDTNANVSFLGAGVYNHYKPVIVDHVISRSDSIQLIHLTNLKFHKGNYKQFLNSKR